jgi:hypothetical protein
MKEIIELVNEYSNDMELGKQVRKLYYEHQEKIQEYMKLVEGKFIYESPDKGETIYQRPLGSPLSERTLVDKSKSSIFPPEVEYTDEYYKSTFIDPYHPHKTK